MSRGAHNIVVAATVLRVMEAFLITTALLLRVIYVSAHPESLVLHGLLTTLLTVFAIAVIVQVPAESLFSPGHHGKILWRVALDAGVGFALSVLVTGQLGKYDVVKIYPYRWEWTLGLTAVWLVCIVTRRHIIGKLTSRGLLARRIIVVSDPAGDRRLEDLRGRVPGRLVIVDRVEDFSLVTAENLAELARRVLASEIVFCTPDTVSPELLRKLPRHLAVSDLQSLYERETGRVDLSAVCVNPEAGPRHRLLDLCKRSLDIGGALLGVVATLPVMLMAAVAIKSEDGGPVLFRQVRVGLGGKLFTLYKFRSMCMNAEQDAVPVWAAEKDPRITRVGSIIRRFRIDELPQFYNVLRGDMSLIGPRPERPYFVQQLAESVPNYQARHAVKPGITGWAQISFQYGASFEDACEKTAYDLYYVRHRSILLDLLILVGTVRVILWPHGVR
jgi:exopolysaccharide biosynthesis polyprenyl glycosylphosphotransferase